MNIQKLVASPKAGSLQAEFESIMMLIGWSRGAMSISEDGEYYLSHDVNMHFQCFISNKFS